MKGIAVAGELILALLAFFGWKEGLVRHGWNEHDRCISERRRDMPLEQAITACSSDEAFNQWRDAVSGSSDSDGLSALGRLLSSAPSRAVMRAMGQATSSPS